MRERVRLLNQQYKEVQGIQTLWQDDKIDEREMRHQLHRNLEQWRTPSLVPLGEPTPTWTGRVLPYTQAWTKGLVTTTVVEGTVTFKPKEGPLNWEISLRQTGTPRPLRLSGN